MGSHEEEAAGLSGGEEDFVVLSRASNGESREAKEAAAAAAAATNCRPLEATSSSNSSLMNEANEAFDLVHGRLSRIKLVPFTIRAANRDTLRLLGVREASTEVNSLVSAIHESLRCNTCKEFLSTAALMVGEDGRGPLAAAMRNVSAETEGIQMYSELSAAIEKCPVQRLQVATEKRFGVVTAGGFPHFFFSLASKTKASMFSASDYEWFFHQHVETMEQLLAKENQEGIMESLDVLIRSLPDITYGDKLLHSAKWFRSAMAQWRKDQHKSSSRQESLIIAMRVLCDTPLNKGFGHERIVCTHLKQVKDNTLEAMRVADNRAALVNLLQERLSPHNYCRPKTKATKGQLEEARKLFKGMGFNTSLMLLENLPKYGGKLAAATGMEEEDVQEKLTDAFSLWGLLASSRKQSSNRSMSSGDASKKNGVAGLAARCDGDAGFPDNLREIMDNLDSFPGLELKTTSHTPVAVTEYPERAREAFLYEHLWGFYNGVSISDSRTKFDIPSGFCRVRGMLQLGDRSMFLAVEGAKVPDNPSSLHNTCFPAFLSPAYHRRCRFAFEELNTRSHMALPEGFSAQEDREKFALGVGTSAVNKDSMSLGRRPMTFRFKNKEYAVDKL